MVIVCFFFFGQFSLNHSSLRDIPQVCVHKQVTPPFHTHLVVALSEVSGCCGLSDLLLEAVKITDVNSVGSSPLKKLVYFGFG